MGLYLCYDIRGIQSFIFRVPKLKYIIGGSAIVDRFDREIMPQLPLKTNQEHIYSAGGKGSFYCVDEDQIIDLKK